MYFFPEIVVVPQSLEQLKKETITNQAHVCWHPRNLCFDFLNNARELLLRQALRTLKESLSAVCGAYVNKGGEASVYILFLNLLILCEFIKVSGKKYIIRKVWLYTIYTIYQLCNGWVEVLSYYSVYIQTHNGTLTVTSQFSHHTWGRFTAEYPLRYSVYDQSSTHTTCKHSTILLCWFYRK